MKILLKKDRRTIEFVDGIDKLNANDVMVNTLEVELESPLLHGETLWVTFEKKEARLEMTKPILATNEYKVTVPAGVIKVPGEWSLQLLIKRYDAVSKNLVSRQASIMVTFTVENGLYVDDEMDLANNGSLASLYSIADKNTQELPLTLQHLMDFTNQPFYASDGSLAVEKSGITYNDLMAKLKGDADTLTLADIVTTWKREAFNRDARVGDEFFGTARTKDDYIVGLNCKVIKVDESEERKGRPYWGVTDVEIIRYPDKEIALVSNITLEFSKTYAEIVALTNAGADVDSFPVDGLNRRPNIGERFFAVCTSGDKYGFGMTAEVVGFATAAEGREYAVFKCIEVVLLAGSTIPKQVKELQRRMSKIDGGEGESEGEGEESTAIIPLVLNNSIALGDIKVEVTSSFSVDITQFNRKPAKYEYFVAIAYDVLGNSYAIRAAVRSVSTDSVSCRITKVNILHDEERLSKAVDKTGDTMTGPLTVSNVDGSVSYQADRLHQATGHSERSIFLPPIRENTPTEENPSAGYLDETLVARSEIDPLEAKLDTVEGIAKGAQIAESFTSYEMMVNTLMGEFLGGSDGLTELKYKKGQSIYIETVDVPDLWVSRVEEDNFNPYLYTTDAAIVSALATNGYIQVGHYRLAQLETGKVNLEGIPENIQDGSGNGAIQQIADGVADGFDFTDKNPNATALDPSLTGIIPYGATGDFANAFGGKSAAIGKRSHAEGTTTIAKGKYSHAEGDNSVALEDDSHAEGNTTVSKGNGAHAEGRLTVAEGDFSHAEGLETRAVEYSTHAEGVKTRATKQGAHAEGYDTTAGGNFSHAEGEYSKTEAEGAHAEGYDTTASGSFSHSEGYNTTASGSCSHAEGNNTTASGSYSHAGGCYTIASGDYSYAEGNTTRATGKHSHTAGYNTTASGDCAYADGNTTEASGNHSHASGYQTKAIAAEQFVVGRWNKPSEDNLFEVGAGWSEETRRNAFEVKSNGTAYAGGKKLLMEGDNVGSGGTLYWHTVKGTFDDTAFTMQEDIEFTITFLSSSSNCPTNTSEFANLINSLGGDLKFYYGDANSNGDWTLFATGKGGGYTRVASQFVAIRTVRVYNGNVFIDVCFTASGFDAQIKSITSHTKIPV